MDHMAVPPPGSLAARVAQARAQRLREMERRVSEARQVLQPPDGAHGGPQSADVAVPRTPDAPLLVGGLAQQAAGTGGDRPDDMDELAALRRTFAGLDEAAENGRHAPLSNRGVLPTPGVAPTPSGIAPTPSQGPAPADELRLARTEIAQLHAQARRAQEELAGIRRRSERDREELGHAARGEAIVQMLPIVDDLERALAQVPAALRDDPWVAGIMMIGDSLQRVLERQGVERIAPCHAPFDPHLHEAVAHVEATDVAEDMVIQVYRPGYTYNGRVLRAAQVQVAVKKEQ